ncbi:hypothetical protein FS749_001200 [Ceratobasidium sp. UAMH 11750]|nr:hypothetical protein FS749_001200 [Ceratobasidium sp. UAMH 11750]
MFGRVVSVRVRPKIEGVLPSLRTKLATDRKSDSSRVSGPLSPRHSHAYLRLYLGLNQECWWGVVCDVNYRVRRPLLNRNRRYEGACRCRLTSLLFGRIELTMSSNDTRQLPYSELDHFRAVTTTTASRESSTVAPASISAMRGT